MHSGHHLLWNWYLQNQQMVGLRLTLTHTHSSGNHSSHSNKDIFHGQRIDFPAFHSNEGSVNRNNDSSSILLLQQVCSEHVLIKKKKMPALLSDASGEAS